MARCAVPTARQRAALFDLPSDEATVLRHYVLSDADRAHVRRRRRDRNRLGLALQLCAFRHPGRLIARDELIPEAMLAFVGAQLGLNGEALADCAARPQTHHDHARHPSGASASLWPSTLRRHGTRAVAHRRCRCGPHQRGVGDGDAGRAAGAADHRARTDDGGAHPRRCPGRCPGRCRASDLASHRGSPRTRRSGTACQDAVRMHRRRHVALRVAAPARAGRQLGRRQPTARPPRVAGQARRAVRGGRWHPSPPHRPPSSAG